MKCSICKEEINGFGNNPYPIRVSENARCCDRCNDKYVLYFRLGLVGAKQELVEECATTLNKFSITDLDKMIRVCESV